MKFKKGERIRVKTWVEMANDMRTILNKDKSISHCEFPDRTFSVYMEKFCGLKATVSRALDTGEIFLHFDGDVRPEQFMFFDWMLEKIEE